jgi:hypothetical protein
MTRLASSLGKLNTRAYHAFTALKVSFNIIILCTFQFPLEIFIQHYVSTHFCHALYNTCYFS